MKKLSYLLSVVTAMILVPAVKAHPGHHENDWLHSFYTLDHLLVMLTVGGIGLTVGVALMVFGPQVHVMQRRMIGASVAVLSLVLIAYGVFL